MITNSSSYKLLRTLERYSFWWFLFSWNRAKFLEVEILLSLAPVFLEKVLKAQQRDRQHRGKFLEVEILLPLAPVFLEKVSKAHQRDHQRRETSQKSSYSFSWFQFSWKKSIKRTIGIVGSFISFSQCTLYHKYIHTTVQVSAESAQVGSPTPVINSS
ncbi:uncharacterized protein LOC127012091 [Drosophila biarmipes]|uniref:uncharacterized protein LOC127012091 n=1 Tax=Drosophila biarmipes TaxID=125945 RepID=UPI0021CC8BCE|nr:uncharacterized protein LOC127012091 [Drosophila biarmipes]